MSSADGTQPCNNSKTPDKPYGDCSKQQYKALDKAVGYACKGPKRACRPGQSCDELRTNLGLNQKCVDARRNLMDTCFNGGDPVHQRVLNDELANVAKCQELINADPDCRKQPNPEPVPVPVPTPTPEQAPGGEVAPAAPPETAPANPPPQSHPDTGSDSGSGISIPTLSPAQQQELAQSLGVSVATLMVMIVMGMIILSPVGI